MTAPRRTSHAAAAGIAAAIFIVASSLIGAGCRQSEQAETAETTAPQPSAGSEAQSGSQPQPAPEEREAAGEDAQPASPSVPPLPPADMGLVAAYQADLRPGVLIDGGALADAGGAEAQRMIAAACDETAARGVRRIVWSNLPLNTWPAGFTMYEHVRFYDPPGRAVRELALPRMPMIHNKDVRAEYDGDWLDVSRDKVHAAIALLGLDAGYEGPVVIDYEPYMQPWDDDRTIAAWLEAIDAVREALPRARVAVFGPPTIRYRLADDGRTFPIEIARIAPVMDAVDFIAPQIYTARSEWSEDVERMERHRMEKSLSFGKPVIPFIWPKTSGRDGDAWMDVAVIQSRIDLLREMGAEGVVVWDKVDLSGFAIQDTQLAKILEQTRPAMSAADAWVREVSRFRAAHPHATVGVALHTRPDAAALRLLREAHLDEFWVADDMWSADDLDGGGDGAGGGGGVGAPRWLHDAAAAEGDVPPRPVRWLRESIAARGSREVHELLVEAPVAETAASALRREPLEPPHGAEWLVIVGEDTADGGDPPAPSVSAIASLCNRGAIVWEMLELQKPTD